MSFPCVRTPGTMGIEGRALPIVADCRKRFDTLRAQAALAGHVLVRSADGKDDVTYTVSRWGWSRAFADLSSVEAWLRVVTGEEVA